MAAVKRMSASSSGSSSRARLYHAMASRLWPQMTALLASVAISLTAGRKAILLTREPISPLSSSAAFVASARQAAQVGSHTCLRAS